MASKYPREIKLEMGKRLNEIFDDGIMTQAELARAIHRSESYITQVKKGRTHISEDVAKAINEVVPGYSVDYLMVESPYHNEEERRLEELKQARHEDDLLSLGFGAISEMLGYKLTATLRYAVERVEVENVDSRPASVGAPLDEDATAEEIAEYVTNRLGGVEAWDRYTPEPRMTVARDGVSVEIARAELNSIMREVAEFADFKLTQAMKRHEDDGR